MSAVVAFPFDAVVGQDDAKLALRLAAIDPLIGGVLLRGEKGSAKTTLARGLAAFLADAPFVDLPLGTTEDRLIGTLDVRAALGDGEFRFEPGLLAAAHGGVLYVDEINLLADHLVDTLLDVAVSGQNVVERDGVSHRHPARFVLVGSMNPEEGELRPQLLDRFGLCVEVRASNDLRVRAEAVRRRLAFDRGALASDAVVASASTAPDIDVATVMIDDAVIEAAARLAVGAGVEGLRADLSLCRGSAALAALDGRVRADVDDVRRVAPLVLAHRCRRGPFDPPVVPPEDLDETIQEALGPRCDPTGPGAGQSEPGHGADEVGDDQSAPPDDVAGAPDAEGDGSGLSPDRAVEAGAPRRPPMPAPTRTTATPRGRAIRDVPAVGGAPIAVVPSMRAAARRPDHGSSGDGAVEVGDLRSVVRVSERSRLVVLCVDLSGSMGAPARASAAAGAVLGLLGEAYERRQHVALITFRGTDATTVVSPTRSVEVARNRLDDLVTGGATPLAAGLAEALAVATRGTDDGTDGLVVVLTDGRATGPGGFDDALTVAAALRRSSLDTLVLDCETGTTRLGLAETLAAAMGARYQAMSDLAADTVVRSVRAAVGSTR